jgi:small subunit ribosomal protein S3
MVSKKFVQIKKDEFKVKEFVKKSLGKGKISDITIERTPIGEKVIVYTTRPGLIIGRKGEKIAELTDVLKKEFKLENPHIDISEIKRPDLDAQSMADEIAMMLERFGPLKFKIVAYKALQKITEAGALGAELRLSGRLPSERAKSWRFAFGLMKKTGDVAKIVNKAQTVAQTNLGVIGVKVSILPSDVAIHDRIELDKEIIDRDIIEEVEVEETDKKEKKGRKKKNGNN